MRQLRYNIAITLDGYIASLNHSTSWIIEDSSIDFTTLYSEFSTFIMGRKTYETMLCFGDLNPLKDYPREAIVVPSQTMECPDVTVIRERVMKYVRALKSEEGGKGRDIWFMGGAKLAGVLMEEDLVDALEVAVMPVVIGEGVKMMEFVGGGQIRLRLASVESKERGIIMTRYAVAFKKPL
ncbi:hypothetical protein DPSP01_014415 [Paraphaeosphaeria sporulosa]